MWRRLRTNVKTTHTIAPLSRLSLLLAIARAREVGFNHYAAALVKLYLAMYGEESCTR